MTNPISYRTAAILLVLGAILTAGNWYLRPERAAVWAMIATLFTAMAAALLFVLRRPEEELARQRVRESIVSATIFAGMIMIVSLSAKLATALGLLDNSDFSHRATMVFLGMFFVVTGNSMPKTLTPLSALRCDASKVQTFQRFAGWMWVLTGLGFSLAWLVLPLGLAKPVSVTLMVICMVTIMTQLVRLRRTRAT